MQPCLTYFVTINPKCVSFIYIGDEIELGKKPIALPVKNFIYLDNEDLAAIERNPTKFALYKTIKDKCPKGEKITAKVKEVLAATGSRHRNIYVVSETPLKLEKNYIFRNF